MREEGNATQAVAGEVAGPDWSVRVHCSRGERTLRAGMQWLDGLHGSTWEVVEPAGGSIYSPSGFGGTPTFWCKPVGELPKGAGSFLGAARADGCVSFCGDSIAAGLIASSPAPARQADLTDERIQALWHEACNDSPSAPGWCRHIRFARAILSEVSPARQEGTAGGVVRGEGSMADATKDDTISRRMALLILEGMAEQNDSAPPAASAEVFGLRKGIRMAIGTAMDRIKGMPAADESPTFMGEPVTRGVPVRADQVDRSHTPLNSGGGE